MELNKNEEKKIDTQTQEGKQKRKGLRVKGGFLEMGKINRGRECFFLFRLLFIWYPVIFSIFDQTDGRRPGKGEQIP